MLGTILRPHDGIIFSIDGSVVWILYFSLYFENSHEWLITTSNIIWLAQENPPFADGFPVPKTGFLLLV